MLVLNQRLYSSFLSSAMLKKFKYSDSRILETFWTYYFDAVGAKVCMDRYLDRIGLNFAVGFFSDMNGLYAILVLRLFSVYSYFWFHLKRNVYQLK